MIFYKNHNLLMYSKVIMTIFKSPRKIIVNEITENFKESSKKFDLNDDLSDVKEIQRDFQ